MRICLVAHLGGKSGANRALLETVEALQDRGHVCHVVVPTEGKLTRELDQMEVDYRTFPYSWWISDGASVRKRFLKLVQNIAASLVVSFYIYDQEPEIVISNTVSIFVGAFASRLLNIPHVWYFHEFGREDHGFSFDYSETISYVVIDRLSTVAVANSHAVKRKYERHLSNTDIHVLYQTVDICTEINDDIEEFPISHPDIILTIVGEIKPGKGQKDAILAVRRLRERDIDAALYIVGSESQKSYAAELRELVRKYRLKDRVIFTGFVDDQIPYMRAADIVLMCSRMEAFGRVTVEAMKCGTPVIGTHSGGTKELIKPGLNGDLYKPGDPQELASKLEHYCQYKQEIARMGENAKKWARRTFSKDIYSKALEDVLTVCAQSDES